MKITEDCCRHDESEHDAHGGCSRSTCDCPGPELEGCCGIYAAAHRPDRPNAFCSCDCHRGESVDCPVCRELLPLAGPDGFVRHMLAVHPESSMARSIFARLIEVQLMDVETVGQVRESLEVNPAAGCDEPFDSATADAHLPDTAAMLKGTRA